MKPVKASLLLHPVFVISLILLLLNDFYWKYEHGNWFTGKLSDFAGLIVLPIFLTQLFKQISKAFSVILCTLFFIWWKSPLSQTAIDFFNQTLSIPIHRTEDYSDLFALFILPLVFVIRPQKYNFPEMVQKVLALSLSAVTIISLCSTSYYRHLPYDKYTPNEVRYTQEFCWAGDAEEVLQGLRDKRLIVSMENERYYPLSPEYRELFYRVERNDSFVKWQPLSFMPDSIVYIKERLYNPHYIIPEYSYEGEVFKNIRFRIYPQDGKRKKICVQMISFESINGAYETHPDKKTRKKLKKYFESLFGIQLK